jgi:hypothetical protein
MGTFPDLSVAENLMPTVIRRCRSATSAFCDVTRSTRRPIKSLIIRYSSPNSQLRAGVLSGGNCEGGHWASVSRQPRVLIRANQPAALTSAPQNTFVEGCSTSVHGGQPSC